MIGTKPKVTVIVVNYNSYSKWAIISQCLKSILGLWYRPLEIIVVDNGSTDGSYELIKSILENIEQSDELRVKLIRLSKNYGFAVANIIAYNLRDPNSKYIALINNDLAPKADSLDRLIDILERYPRIAGVQGIILTWDEKYIDSYGCQITQHGVCYAVGFGLEACNAHKLRPTAVSYIDGAFSVYRVKAVEEAGGLFLPYFFMYGDDYELGIRLWRNRWILLGVPIIVGRHYRCATTSIDDKRDLSKPPRMLYNCGYWSWLSEIAVLTVLYERIWLLRILERIPTTLAASLLRRSKAITRGYIDGIMIGIKLRKKLRLGSLINEPRLHVRIFSEFVILMNLFIRHGSKANKIYYSVITRSLGRRSMK